MRFFPLLTAVLVSVALFYVVLEREALLQFARSFGTEETTEVAAPVTEEAAELPVAIATTEAAEAGEAVHVIALRSVASDVPDAVMVRGQSEAAREVTVQAETSGIVISEPLRKGQFVEAGQMLCELDPGTRQARVAEAEARLAEARARLPEARARIAEAAARGPEAEARLREARARLPEVQSRVTVAEAGRADTTARIAEAEARLEEARINQNAAQQLSEGGFASQTRVANADATLRTAEAGLVAAQTGLEATEADIESARASVEGARAQIESAQASVAAAEAGVENARAGVAGAEAAIESAEAGVEAARLEIDKLTIEAPFAGLLESDTAELGALLQAGAPGSGDCAVIVQLDPMKLVGFLPEAQVDRIEVGAQAGARLASGAEVVGQVTFLSRSADDLTRTFRVEVTVPNADLTIRDGQTAEILIGTDPTRAHMIPASALTLNDMGALGLRVIEDGVTGFAPVTLIRDTPQGVLLGGLPDAVDVIIVGQEYVTEGVPVRATYETPESLRASQEATQ
ncbi:efflux RND transporter periplasmic adaptor subunit [Jannaschia sp. M317]|uniref:efflux RND transporter periplasmic adaptor subunit n=1 Tax=Jannaschia sp. M317 TaxID=2867011 RepID=UPI0021A90B3F|nr:efflux RND transporter periplasmic adaptor subunit [Jannaschia sp. M317]UWQ16327.1 efflux RND transporter periplasmic adaptor subunit [Jannaschia sp. M317]